MKSHAKIFEFTVYKSVVFEGIMHFIDILACVKFCFRWMSHFEMEEGGKWCTTRCRKCRHNLGLEQSIGNIKSI